MKGERKEGVPHEQAAVGGEEAGDAEVKVKVGGDDKERDY